MPNPRESRWRRFLNLHPEPGERWRALDDTTPLFHLGFLVVFGTGFVAMVAAPNVNTVLRSLLTGLPITVLEVLSGALIFALLAAGVVGLGSWRATFAELSQGGHWRTTGWLGIGLGLGMILGQIFSFTGYFDLAIQESEPLSQIVTFELLWGLLLTAGLVVFLWWVEAGASTWLEVAAADRSVRSYYTIATVIATVWLAVWLGLLLFVHGLGSLGPQWLMFSPLGMWAIIQNPITTLLVISLWAVPLAAWFWRRRMRSVNEAGWAYLDSAPQLSPLSLQASLRPRLSFVVGLAGGAVYCVLLAIIRAALRLVVPEAQRGTEEFILLFVSASITLAALLQAGVATVVAARVRRLGWVHGLFAAFVAGFTMTLGFLGLNLMFGGNVNGALFWNVFSQIVNGGALLALPCALTASAVSDRLRRSHARSMEKATVSLKA